MTLSSQRAAKCRGLSEGECGICGCLAAFRGLCVAPKSSKGGVTDSLSALLIASILPLTGRADFANPRCHPSPNLRIFRWGRGYGERVLPANSPCPPATGACHAPVQASRKKIDFCANFIREISMKVSTCYQRKSGNIPRLSRYSCRACSRSSAVGAVLYFAYNSWRTSESNFCSNPCLISFRQSSSSIR